MLLLLLSCARDVPAALTAEPSPSPDPLCSDPFVTDLAAGARMWATTELGAADYGTGSALFDEEWLFGTWMMAAAGLGQHALRCPEAAGDDLPAMEAAIARMTSPSGRAFDTRSWGSDLDARIASDRGSIALLGYGGLALALYRAAAPKGRFVGMEAEWAAAIARRLGGGLVETYPGQWYPVDNAAAVGALALHDRLSGEDHGREVEGGLAAIRALRDPATGLLCQAADGDGRPIDAPRGSGTFLAAWFLLHADPVLASDLYESGRDALSGEVLGLFAMREYPAGSEGTGDVDSGPLLLGYSVSATGFALAGATATGDTATRDRILGTVHRGGPLAVRFVPGLGSDGGQGATGSHLGDAILLAMLTAGGP